jgi:hypothetical protein
MIIIIGFVFFVIDVTFLSDVILHIVCGDSSTLTVCFLIFFVFFRMSDISPPTKGLYGRDKWTEEHEQVPKSVPGVSQGLGKTAWTFC